MTTVLFPLYDRPDLFEAYSRLPRSTFGLGAAPEWPALRRMLPDMPGLRVVDLGCGFGWLVTRHRQEFSCRALGPCTNAIVMLTMRSVSRVSAQPNREQHGN